MPQGKGLLGALAYYGIPSVDAIYKDKIRQLIMRGWPSARENKPEILKYVMTDVDPLFDLFSRLMAEPEFDLSTALHWGEFVAVSAQMEHRGVPLDEVVTDLLDKKAWAYVRDAVVPKINAQYDVYVQDKAGEWHFNNEKFDALCARLGINWPRTESGKPNLEQKTLKSMCVAFPELESLRQLRHARDKMRKIKLAVGSDGRNRTVCGRSSRRHRARNRKRQNGSSLRQCGCASLSSQAPAVPSRILIGPRCTFRSQGCFRTAKP